VGGLAVAARLAAQRHEVTVLERSSNTGGVTVPLVKDGFTFSGGAGVLTLPAVYRDLFLKTGDSLEDTVDLVEVDPATRLVFDGVSVDLPNAARDATAQALDAGFGAGSGEAWNHLLARGGEMWDTVRKQFIEVPYAEGDPARPRSAGTRADWRTTVPWRSLRSLGRAFLPDPRLRAYLEHFAVESGGDGRRAPATVAVQPYLEQTFGLWYVRGGLHRISEALEERCRGLGVKIHTDTEVVGITRDGPNASVDGVRTADGGRFDTDLVVSGAAMQRPKLSPLGTERRGPTSVFALHLAVRDDGLDLPHRSHFFGTRRGEPTLTVYAPHDASLAPTGHRAVTVHVRVPRQGSGGRDWKADGVRDSYAQRLLDQLTERGLPLRDRLLWHESRSPADVEAAGGLPGGALGGAAFDGLRADLLRTPNRAAVPGLFHVGESAHPGGGLMRVGMSAALVAEEIGRAKKKPKKSS
jgi:phytoene dehydrogenase-like protein